MIFKLRTQSVGPYGMNTYVIIDPETQSSAIIDPGGEPEKIMAMVGGTKVDKILITHGHGDHVMVLDDIKTETAAPVYLHPNDAEQFGLSFEIPLNDGETIKIGNLDLKVIHIPGHTPGQCCFDLGDGRIIVGDTLFVGGPGRTTTSADFTTTMQNMQNIVFKWADETQFFPGHGPSGQIGIERQTFEDFVNQGWPPDTHGDVTWK